MLVHEQVEGVNVERGWNGEGVVETLEVNANTNAANSESGFTIGLRYGRNLPVNKEPWRTTIGAACVTERIAAPPPKEQNVVLRMVVLVHVLLELAHFEHGCSAHGATVRRLAPT